MKPKFGHLPRLGFIAHVFIGLSSHSANAASQTWDNGSLDSTWNTTSTNWAASAWTNNNDAIFGASGVGTVNISSGVIVNDITFNTTGYTLAGNLMLANDLASTFTLNANQTISAVIANNTGGASSLTKAGTSTLTLSGTNTLSGATSITNGALVFSGTGSLANSALTIGTVKSGLNTSLTVTPTTNGSTTRSAGLTWNGGLLPGSNNAHNFTVSGAAAGNTIENFGALTLNSGLFNGSIAANAASNTRVVFDSVTRAHGTAMDFARSATGIGAQTIASQTANTANVVFTTAPTLYGNGGTGTSISIIPWAASRMTYDSTNGLRGLAGSETVALSSGMGLGTGSAGQNANTASITLAADTTVNSLAGGGAVGLGGKTLTITSGYLQAGTNTTIGSTVNDGVLALGQEGHFFVDNTRNLTINSSISGTDGLTVSMNNFNASSANLVLAGSNTFTGVTTFLGNRASDMYVRLTNSLALQNSTLDHSAYGAGFAFGNGGTTGLTAYTLGGLIGDRNINLNNNNTTVGAVALTIGSTGSADTSSTVNSYSGVLSNTVTGGSIIKDGVATQVFSGSNTYSGGTTLKGGVLRIDNANAIGTTGNLSFSGGTLQYGAGITTDFSARIASGTSTGAVSIDTGTNNVIYATALTASQSGGLTKSGLGTLNLNATNLFTGGLVVKAGTVATNNGSGFGADGITLGDAGNQDVTLSISGWNSFGNAANVVGTGVHTINLNHNNSGQSQTAGSITLNSNDIRFLQSTGNNASRQSNAITGTGNVVIESAASGSGYFRLDGANVINNAGTFTHTGTGTNPFYTQNNSTFGTNVTSLVQNSATSVFGLNTSQANFGGTVQVLAGKLDLNNTASLKSNNEVFVASGSTLDVRQNNTIKGLGNVSGSGGLVTNSNTSDTVLSVGGSGTYTFAGVLADGAANKLGLNISGSGTQTLTGTSTYTGATSISGSGTLALAATGSIDNTSGVSLGTSGTFDISAKGGYTVSKLSGSGNVTGALTVSTQLAIGNSPGTVNFSSNLTLGAGSTYIYELTSGASPGVGSADLGIVTGDLTIVSGAILDLVELGTYTANNKFTLFGYTGSVSGTFYGLADDSTFTDDLANSWRINYNDTTAGANGGTGTKFVTITAVPEPNAALLVGGLGMLALLRRRRR